MKRVANWLRNVAFATFGTGAISLGAVCLLPVFEPCRILYRTHNPVQDTVACKVFTALNVVWPASFLIGCVAAITATYLAARNRIAEHKPSRTRQPFEIGRVPRIDLGSGSVTVDIGYLDGEEHRQAFAAIFGRMLKDNASLLADSQLTRVDATRPIGAEVTLPIAAHHLVASPERLALALYDSGNERVRLEFAGPGTVLRIDLGFDNPEFSLE